MELATEYPPPGEDAAIREIVHRMQRAVARDYPSHVRPMRRAVHTKGLGCVRAQFRVSADIPVDLRHGVFAHPTTYEAVLRFSNAMMAVQPDTAKDMRGVGIKLLGVGTASTGEADAPTQDFLMVNGPAFFVRDVPEFLEFMTTAEAGNPLAHFFGWNPLKWKLRQLRIFLRSLGTIQNPLTVRYWSQTPYRLGPHAIKFSIVPKHSSEVDARAAGDDHLRSALSHSLARGDASFDFLVQRQTDAETMPIEDATVEWSEAAAPFTKVATVHIPRQRFDSDELRHLEEHLTFMPWHALPTHQPLGGLNRARRVAYEALSRARHEANEVPMVEPKGHV